MKKFLALLLALLMLFTCACGGGDKEPKYDRSEAIKPVSGEEAVTLYDSTLDQTLTLTRVTTDSRTDAADLLDLVYTYLESLGITANIKSMYTIPFGLAGNWNEYLPIKVFFDGESVQPIYVLVLKDGIKYTKGITAFASFRDSDISNNEYFNKTTGCIDKWEKDLRDALGFNAPDKNVYFPIFMTRDLPFALPSESEKSLYENMSGRYYKYMLALWYNELDETPQYINGNYYQRLNRDDIRSLDDLGKFLGEAFTQDRVSEIRSARSFLESGDYPIYLEHDGAMYIAPNGMGGPEDLENVEVKYTAQNGDYLFCIIEATRVERNWDTWEVTDRYYEEYICVFEKSGDSWLCDCFTDISYGFYQTMF